MQLPPPPLVSVPLGSLQPSSHCPSFHHSDCWGGIGCRWHSPCPHECLAAGRGRGVFLWLLAWLRVLSSVRRMGNLALSGPGDALNTNSRGEQAFSPPAPPRSYEWAGRQGAGTEESPMMQAALPALLPALFSCFRREAEAQRSERGSCQCLLFSACGRLEGGQLLSQSQPPPCSHWVLISSMLPGQRRTPKCCLGGCFLRGLAWAHSSLPRGFSALFLSWPGSAAALIASRVCLAAERGAVGTLVPAAQQLP